MLDISSLFVASAFAQDSALPPEPSPLAGMIPFALVIIVFWFFIIRPQSKRYKEHQNLVLALKKGDRVITGGGIIGKITKAAEGSETVEVEIASGVSVEVSRSTITGLAPALEKKAPVAAKKKKPAPANSQTSQTTANDN